MVKQFNVAFPALVIEIVDENKCAVKVEKSEMITLFSVLETMFIGDFGTEWIVVCSSIVEAAFGEHFLTLKELFLEGYTVNVRWLRRSDQLLKETSVRKVLKKYLKKDKNKKTKDLAHDFEIVQDESGNEVVKRKKGAATKDYKKGKLTCRFEVQIPYNNKFEVSKRIIGPNVLF